MYKVYFFYMYIILVKLNTMKILILILVNLAVIWKFSIDFNSTLWLAAFELCYSSYTDFCPSNSLFLNEVVYWLNYTEITIYYITHLTNVCIYIAVVRRQYAKL